MKSFTPREKEAVTKFAERVKEALGENLISLKLFGSKVRGDAKKDSDIDILLVVKNKNVKLRDKVFDILFDIDPYDELKISPVIFSEFDYKKNEEMHAPFTEDIKKEGIPL